MKENDETPDQAKGQVTGYKGRQGMHMFSEEKSPNAALN